MFLMVHPSKTLTLGRLQASLVCSRLIAFFMVSDLLDQLHRVADSRSSSPPRLGGVRGRFEQAPVFFMVSPDFWCKDTYNINAKQAFFRFVSNLFRTQNFKCLKFSCLRTLNSQKPSEKPSILLKTFYTNLPFSPLVIRRRMILSFVYFCAFPPKYSRRRRDYCNLTRRIF